MVEHPKGKQTIGCKWLYKPKINADGTIDKLKVGLVVKGYSQKEGIDYEETFAPIAKLDTIRMLISIATNKHWMIHRLDVKSTFLNGELKTKVCLEQTKGFVQKGKENLLCKLKNSLYGLKKAPRSWYEKIYSFFLQLGYNISKNNPNIYTMKDENGHIVLISLYIYDLIIIGDAISIIKEIKQKMSKVFGMKYLGELRYYLGLEICRDLGQTFLSKVNYVKGLLERFRMDQCKATVVPLQHKIKL